MGAQAGKNRDADVELLLDCILTLRDADECYEFFEDLCTMQEIQSMVRRLAVAKMLTEDRRYDEIVGKTGASTATISRVNRSLCFGNGGYVKAFARCGQKEEK